MSVAATNAYSTATGNGAATSFPFTFACQNVADVSVYVNGVLQNSGYSVTLNSDFNGGTVLFSVAPANAATIIIASVPDFTQQIQFENAGPYNPASVDNALDAAAIRAIFLNGLFARTALAPVGETMGPLPAKTSRAGLFFGWDAGGNPAALNPGGADSALRTDLAASTGASLVGWIASGVGAVLRTIRDKLRESVTPEDFGAAGDGVTNDAAAVQAAFNASNRVRLSKSYLLGSTVTLPANAKLIGDGRGVATLTMSANSTMLTVGGSGVGIRGVSLIHSGDGKIIDATHDDDLIIEDCELHGSNAASTNTMLLCSGSFLGLRRNVITNDRTAAYALTLDRTGTTIDIESHVEQNRIGGAGKGMWIGSSDNSHRPEGLHLTDNSFICTNINLWIEQLLEGVITGNVFDQGNAQNIVLKPVNEGIQALQITSNWISTPNQTVTGIGIQHDDTNSTVGLTQINIAANTFAIIGTGVKMKSPASQISIIGNSFGTVGTANINLTDGASGGPFIIENNAFDPTKPVTRTVTSSAKFVLGSHNSGRKLSGWATVQTDSTTKPSGSSVTIPHGLDGTPDKSKIITSLVPVGATFTAASQPIVTAVDATNITVLVTFTSSVGGTYNVNAQASL